MRFASAAIRRSMVRPSYVDVGSEAPRNVDDHSFRDLVVEADLALVELEQPATNNWPSLVPASLITRPSGASVGPSSVSRVRCGELVTDSSLPKGRSSATATALSFSSVPFDRDNSVNHDGVRSSNGRNRVGVHQVPLFADATDDATSVMNTRENPPLEQAVACLVDDRSPAAKDRASVSG